MNIKRGYNAIRGKFIFCKIPGTGECKEKNCPVWKKLKDFKKPKKRRYKREKKIIPESGVRDRIERSGNS